MDKKCTHFENVKDKVPPNTEGCEECEKEGTDWVE